MTQKTARIFSLGICLLLLLGLFPWPKPVSAGICVWSAEAMPSIQDNLLGPPGIDIAYIEVQESSETVWVSPCDTTSENVVYKSKDWGLTWTKIATPIIVDYIATAPDDENLVVIVDGLLVIAYLSNDGGLTWQNMGTIQEIPGGDPAIEIFDVKISPIVNDIRYIAVAGIAPALFGNVWYFDYGALSPKWRQSSNFGGFTQTLAKFKIMFSPDFQIDRALAVVSYNSTLVFPFTGVVSYELFNFNLLKWNSSAAYTGFPVAVNNFTGLLNVDPLSIYLAPSPKYSANDLDYSDIFICFTAIGSPDAEAASGIYRFRGATKTQILANTPIYSISYDGNSLIAGGYYNNTVYRSTNPLSPTPTFNTSSNLKSPGGTDWTIVKFTQAGIIAGTSGDESAFSISNDNGVNFDDIGLIDTTIVNARDLAVSGSGNRVYLVTDNGTNTSVWRKASEWKRVLSLKNTTNYIIRANPSNSSEIYLVRKGDRTIYYNTTSGSGAWATRDCTINVQDFIVESAGVIYVLNAAGSVAKSASSGFLWGPTVATNLGNGATIVSAGTNKILVGSQNGFVAYSMNGGTSWTVIPQAIEVGAGNVQVVPDTNFASNNIIYAASDTPGQNIVTWRIGISVAWTDIFSGVIAGGIYGLAINNDILYALEYSAVNDQSTLWRHISPATAAASSTEWNSSTTTATTDADDPNVRLNAAPRALKASNGKLWAVKTNLTNKLYSYTDLMIDITIMLNTPAQGSTVNVNTISGLVYDVVFSWDRPSVATEYELIIAYDEDFLQPIITITMNMTNEVAFILIGPQQPAPANINFIPGMVYYWKIRVTEPGYSPFSVTRYFTIEDLPDAPAQEMVEGQNNMVTGPNPAFSWLPLEGATEYQFRLSDNPEMTEPIIDEIVGTTAIKVNIALEYGRTYYWQVRAITPNKGSWSALVVFTVAEEPVEPSTPVIEDVPPIVVIIPPLQQEESVLLPPASVLVTEVTPVFFYIIVFTLAVLAGVVVVMIYNTFEKRPAVKVPVSRPKGPEQKQEIPGARLSAPEARPEPAKREREPAGPMEKEAMRPPPIEKSKEGAAVVFAAKSFMWMLTEGLGADGGKTGLSEKEEQSLGKKVAERIRELTRKENLYIRHPEDAAMMLRIWLQYGSRGETNRYLAKTFSANPENAIRFLKCYLPPAEPGKPEPSADDFTRTHYDRIAEVVDSDKVYAALAKIFKFTVDAIEEKMPIKPVERNLAFKFMRLHLQKKDEDSKKPRNK
ncbi:MAG: hypothetical protein JXA17_06290 [Dehalococcoidales bacterium]|nr:hypothetical protein [Dehalococcoidales bacterium]